MTTHSIIPEPLLNEINWIVCEACDLSKLAEHGTPRYDAYQARRVALVATLTQLNEDTP